MKVGSLEICWKASSQISFERKALMKGILQNAASVAQGSNKQASLKKCREDANKTMSWNTRQISAALAINETIQKETKFFWYF